MRVLFRVDASLGMGSGHVMRCLTLARALAAEGHQCRFISRAHPGHLHEHIREQGFELHSLPMGCAHDEVLFHGHWLGASQDEDVQACRPLIEAFEPDWLVVDHYALDQRWESAVMPADCRLLVIDDLADREHVCDLLLDQNLGRLAEDYRDKVPAHCQLLTGPHNALLRPEFARLREAALARRATAGLQEVLIALGGVDQHNHSGAVLEALRGCELPAGIRFTVVLGASAPHVEVLREQAAAYPWPVQVLSATRDMAALMVRADLAIGAGGGTSWERCCLGLPTLLMVLAENQLPAALALERSGAAQLLELSTPLAPQLQLAISGLQEPTALADLSLAARALTDGQGVDRMVSAMEALT